MTATTSSASTTSAALRDVLSDLRNGKGKPSRAEVAESLTLCYDIVKQLRSMTDGGAGQRKATELTSACDSQTSGSDSEAGMWTGGWQRVAIGEASAPAAAAPGPEQEAELERMLTVPATRPHHERIPSEELILAFGQQQWLMTAAAYTSTGGPVFRQRVLRCLKVRRWLRMQRVWTEWMRDEGEAPCCDLAPKCQGSCAKSSESQCESEASSEA